MTIRDFQRYLSKVKAKMTTLIQKAKNEPEYRRVGILAVVLLVSTTIMSPLLGIALVLVGVWYLTC
ncbi:hypothetical protein SCARR_05311 [Pontiella sulfatireligans]|uniref:Uncharacterized protein n=1 Tax=Pontiella sulfatireligans TaxID=2750658 RepID=A0A6C2UVJ8_9BACT|nr:hypothetical protein SCARR_05311 [Pontiella sulfatireligans]